MSKKSKKFIPDGFYTVRWSPSDDPFNVAIINGRYGLAVRVYPNDGGNITMPTHKTKAGILKLIAEAYPEVLVDA